MIICSCNVISDHEVRGAVVSAEVELCSTAQVYDCLGCLVQCGRCSGLVRKILEERAAGCLEFPVSPSCAGSRAEIGCGGRPAHSGMPYRHGA
jgi:bacterioferritin-associated ferredoxin